MSKLDIKRFKLTPGNVLVEPAKEETKTSSGIILPENETEKPQHGIVLAVGDALWASGVKEIKSPCKVGDKVIYKKWGVNEVMIEDTEYQFLKFDDILAVIE